MRVLLTSSLGGGGHLLPVVGAAEACVRLGHDVLVVVPPSLAEGIGSTGLRYEVGGQPPRSLVEGIWERVRNGDRGAAGLIDRELFADHCTKAMLGPVREACSSYRAELVIREPCEYASAAAAHEGGIPQAEIGISLAAIEHGVLDMVASIIDSYSPGVSEAIAAAPYLSSFPASLDPSPWARTLRFRSPSPAAAVLPAWWPPEDDRPLVYLTFGTVVAHLRESVDVYRYALEAAGDLDVRVLLTLGRAGDAGELGPLPGNTHVEQWVPQSTVLAHAAAVVCHGGSGTTFGALAAGVPLVICPLFADQSCNAALVEAAGAGLVIGGPGDAPTGAGSAKLRSLGPKDVAPIRSAVEQVLGDPAYRKSAERIGAEMTATPSLDDIIDEHIASRISS